MESIIRQWKQNFLKSSLVSSIDNGIIFLDHTKASALFEAGTENVVPIDCEYIKFLYDGLSHIDGLRIAMQLCTVLNYIGIELSPDNIIAIAGEGQSFLDNFVKKVWYLIRDIDKYDRQNVNDLFKNNSGDLFFIASMKKFIEPFESYYPMYNEHVYDSVCIFSIVKGDVKYHVYLRRNETSYLLSLKSATNVADLKNCDFPIDIIRKHPFHSVSEVIDCLKLNFSSLGYSEYTVVSVCR